MSPHDADDMLYPTLYQRLLTMAEQDDLDVAQCNGERFFAGSQRMIISDIFSSGIHKRMIRNAHGIRQWCGTSCCWR